MVNPAWGNFAPRCARFPRNGAGTAFLLAGAGIGLPRYSTRDLGKADTPFPALPLRRFKTDVKAHAAAGCFRRSRAQTALELKKTAELHGESRANIRRPTRIDGNIRLADREQA